MQNRKYKEFSAGRAGNGSVNLATGELTFVHEDTGSDANILPINISHVYSSKMTADTSAKFTYGKGFRLNLEQTLKKTDPDSNAKYVYTDAKGTEHAFEDRYYYLTDEKKKEYIAISNITIDEAGKLTCMEGGISHDVFLHQISESGLTLQTELKPFKGSEKLETRHEEVVRLTEEITQLEKSIADLNYSIKQYDKPEAQDYNDLLNWQNQIEENSLLIEVKTIQDFKSLENSQKELIELRKNTIKKDSQDINEKINNKSIEIDAQSLLNQIDLMDKKGNLNEIQKNLLDNKQTYDAKEREELKKRYDYLKDIAQKEIEKYTNLLGNKQDVLNKLNLQIPVNFIIDKNNLTMGFNAAGNLVSLFDSYDNQIAIIYEDDVIVKIIDTDNREIVFDYEQKNSRKGRLASITDYKGHKTSFVYGSYGNYDDLKKIEYPNGETSEFLYTQNGLLTEILPPSKTGVRIGYNADKKVESIADLTAAEKVDKNGVTVGENKTENLYALTYDGTTTIIKDIKNDTAESYLFDAEGNAHNVLHSKGDKLIGFTAYDESSISATAKRCEFVMTTDELEATGISEIDILNSDGVDSVAFSDTLGVKKEWLCDLSKLDPDHTDYILCGSATVAAAETTPKRKKTAYCKNYCEHDMNSTNKRIEFKVLVDYQEKPTAAPSDEYTPIKTGDRIDVLYLNHLFSAFPYKNVSSFFGILISDALKIKYYYPILGVGAFNRESPKYQIYYTAKYYIQGAYGCALWADQTLLWCNSLYKDKHPNEGINKVGWQGKKAELDISSWGPITVHSEKMFNWASFISKDGKFLQTWDNTNSGIDEFIAGFDYNTQDRQHVALPVTLRKENGKPIMPKKISVFANFLQNQGEAVFEKPILVKGNVDYAYLDELGKTVFKSAYPQKIAVNDIFGTNSTVQTSVSTNYNDNNLPTERKTVYSYATEIGVSEKNEVEKWFYNPQGSLIEQWNYIEGEELTNGIDITEIVYDERGNAVKSFTYNSLDASTKFYNEQELADDGRTIADIDETGIHKTSYEYDDVTGIVKTVTAPNGGKFSYGHDTNTDDVVAITQSTGEGVENTTNRVYTAGYLTELTGGGNTVNYEYDGKGRTSAIYLNDRVPYAAYEYQERTDAVPTEAVTATIAPTDSALSYSVKTERDKDGNLVIVSEGSSPLSLSESIVNAYYGKEDKDRKGLLKLSEDKTIGTKTEYSYNSLRQPLSATVRDTTTNDVISTVTAEYDEFGQIAKRRIVSGSYTQEYGYRYKDDFEKEPESVSMPYGLSSTRITDVNGRLKEQTLSENSTPLAKEYYYFRKHGDHGTNQISSVRYGERKNGQFIIKDGVSYSYDECGNITEIKENGKLTCHYEYDKLNRLIREDNVKFGTTTLYAYDNNGNILSKRETAFTLKETQKIAEFTDEREYIYDAERPDRLISVGDENILGYDSIGNPSEYRGKTLTWRKGRQLAGVKNSLDTITFAYDANGRRIGKNADGEHTKYVYAGDMLIREEISDENNIVYLGDDLIAGNNATEGDGIVVDSLNKSVVEYYYGLSGVAGLVYNGAKYYFRRNVQGDITRIYSIDGTLAACYTYDAWGNHKVYDANGNENVDPNFVGNVNPYRYRGYYYDVETGLYYCGSRYYDPEVGRWINADDISYIDPETVNGLNLYSYCGNNPVMNVDPNGNSWDSFWNGVGNWFKKNWQWVAGAAIIIGLGLAVILTGGAAAGVAGFIVAGAFKGAVIGAVSSALIGGVIGGFSNGDSWSWNGALGGAKNGFFSGALTGAITGAITSGMQVGQVASLWDKGTFKSGFQSMRYHYAKHGAGFGNIVNYSKQASSFGIRNAASMTFNMSRSGLQNYWTWAGKVGMNGYYTSEGKIITYFWIS